VEDRQVRAARIGEAHVPELDLAKSRIWQCNWSQRRLNLRLGVEDLEQAFRCTGSLGDFSPHPAELAGTAGREHGIKDKLPETTRCDVTGEHVLRTDPKHYHDTGKYQKDHDGSEHAARFGCAARSCIRVFHR